MKKMLSLVLAISMLLSVLPMAFAEGEKSFFSGEEIASEEETALLEKYSAIKEKRPFGECSVKNVAAERVSMLKEKTLLKASCSSKDEVAEEISSVKFDGYMQKAEENIEGLKAGLVENEVNETQEEALVAFREKFLISAGDSEEERETLKASGSSTYASVSYYTGTSIPTYTSVTGRRLYDTYTHDDGSISYSYYYDEDEFLAYCEYLMGNCGWAYEGYVPADDYSYGMYFFSKDGILLPVVANLRYNLTTVMVPKVEQVPVKNVYFDIVSREMVEGNVYEVITTIKPSNATDKTLTWTSSNSKVASVSSDGRVTAKKAGTATITAKSSNGKQASCEMFVSKFVLDYYKNTSIPTFTCVTGRPPVYTTESEGLVFNYYYFDLDFHADYLVYLENKAGWKVVAEETAEDYSYYFLVFRKGSEEIAIMANFEQDYTCVAYDIPKEKPVPVTSLKFTSTKATVYVGNNFDLGEKLTISPLNNNDNITWKSSNPSVATVDENGIVTPIKTGSAKITATAEAGKKSAYCTVTVSRAPEGIMITGAGAVAKGKTTKLTAYAYYEENGKTVKTKDAISWRSDDRTIATVTGGTVKGISAGTTYITAYLEGTDIEEVIEITVAVPITSLKFKSTKLTAKIGDEIDLNESLTISPANNTDTITWTTSKSSVATVDENGIVEIVGAGTAKITVKAVAGSKSAYVTITAKR